MRLFTELGREWNSKTLNEFSSSKFSSSDSFHRFLGAVWKLSAAQRLTWWKVKLHRKFSARVCFWKCFPWTLGCLTPFKHLFSQLSRLPPSSWWISIMSTNELFFSLNGMRFYELTEILLFSLMKLILIMRFWRFLYKLKFVGERAENIERKSIFG